MTSSEYTVPAPTLGRYLHISQRRMLKLIQDSVLKATPVPRGSLFTYHFTLSEATILELATIIRDAGINLTAAIEIARAAYHHGPTHIQTNRFSWRMRVTSNIVITIETKNKAYPLTRAHEF